MSALSSEGLFVTTVVLVPPAVLSLFFLQRWLGIREAHLAPVRFPLTTVLGVTACMLGGMFLASEFLGVVVYVAFFFLMLKYFLKLDGISWDEAFGIPKDGLRKNVFSGIGVIALTLPAVLFLLSLSQIILISLGLEPGLQGSVFRMLESRDVGEIARVVFLALVAAPLVEEFLFRGIIYRRLRVHIEPLGANIIQAALFSGVHFYLAGLLPLFLLGFVLARLFEKNGSLTACVVGHMSFNLFNIGVILLLKWQNVS